MEYYDKPHGGKFEPDIDHARYLTIALEPDAVSSNDYDYKEYEPTADGEDTTIDEWNELTLRADDPDLKKAMWVFARDRKVANVYISYDRKESFQEQIEQFAKVKEIAEQFGPTFREWAEKCQSWIDEDILQNKVDDYIQQYGHVTGWNTKIEGSELAVDNRIEINDIQCFEDMVSKFTEKYRLSDGEHVGIECDPTPDEAMTYVNAVLATIKEKEGEIPVDVIIDAEIMQRSADETAARGFYAAQEEKSDTRTADNNRTAISVNNDERDYDDSRI